MQQEKNLNVLKFTSKSQRFWNVNISDFYSSHKTLDLPYAIPEKKFIYWICV